MATSTIPLEMIPAGWYMSWYMSTQAAFKICVMLSDSDKIYVDNKCRQSQSYGVLDDGFSQVANTGMFIVTTISSSHNIKVVNHPVVIPNVQGDIVAQGYVLCYEDENDQDYNDLYVSIMAWKNKG